MEPEEDAFGQMLMAYHKGKGVFEIVERDDGLTNTILAKIYFSGYGDWHPIEQKAIQLEKGKVLDVGCGAGRHSLYLQKKGFDITINFCCALNGLFSAAVNKNLFCS